MSWHSTTPPNSSVGPRPWAYDSWIGLLRKVHVHLIAPLVYNWKGWWLGCLNIPIASHYMGCKSRTYIAFLSSLDAFHGTMYWASINLLRFRVSLSYGEHLICYRVFDIITFFEKRPSSSHLVMLCRIRWVTIHSFGNAKGVKCGLSSVVSYVWNEQVRLQL